MYEGAYNLLVKGVERKIKIVILGTGSAGFDPARVSTSIAIWYESQVILLDIGAGVVYRLASAPFPLKFITHIFITHFHLDHCGDLPNFLFKCNLPFIDPPQKLTITGPKGTFNLWRGLYKTWGKNVTGRRFNLQLEEIKPGIYNYPFFKIMAFPVKHNEESLGYKLIINNKVILYTGDTEWDEDIIKYAQNSDIGFIECSSVLEPIQNHLTAEQLGKLASALNINTVVPVHLPHSLNNTAHLVNVIRSYFKGEIILPYDNMCILV